MDSRPRQTLGQMSPSQMNSALSTGPSRTIKDGQTGGSKPLPPRPSLALPGTATANRVPPSSRMASGAAGPVQRRSSTYGKGGTGPKSDPRPVSDKAYQQACIRTIISYLTTHDYDHPISAKNLMSPTKKDFEHLVAFLLRQLDPHWRLLGKLEDEVPAMLAWLKYPFQARRELFMTTGVSKSALFAVGAPHTWPGLLAALAWLVEMLSYEEKAAVSRAASFDDREPGERDFFEYVAESYRYFLAADDARCEEVDAAKAAQFEARGASVRDDIDGLEQEGERLQAAVDALAGEASPLAEATARRDEHAYDRGKFHALLENLQAHKATLQRKVAERSAELTAKQQQRAAAEAERTALEARVAAQTFSKEDVLRMTADKSKKVEELQAARELHAAAERKLAESTAALDGRFEEVDTAVQAYNEAADRLALVPATAKRAEGAAFEARLDRSGAAAADMVTADLKGAVKASLGRLRERYAGRARQLAEERFSLAAGLEHAEEARTERAEDIANMRYKVGKLEQKHRGAKGALDEELRTFEARVAELRAEVVNLRGAAAGGGVAASEARIRELAAQLDDTKLGCERDMEALTEEVGAALLLLAEHRKHVQDRLRDVKGSLAAVKDTVLRA